MNDDNPYTVNQEGQGFEVVDESGKTVIGSGDQGNALSYAALLNEAYRRGYKAGYRQAKKS